MTIYHILQSWFKGTTKGWNQTEKDTVSKVYHYDGKKWTHHHAADLIPAEGHKEPKIKNLTAKQIDRIMRSQTKL